MQSRSWALAAFIGLVGILLVPFLQANAGSVSSSKDVSIAALR
jgi:hypothetical protein